ncbi:conserved hypothetical protein [Lebetimonas natsushimae]|uniref:Uncharacterized protein n=1 Tax=Lebetimonas natsushimae TaxID=1936991 RepID=A0A292YBI5_9BACT|nr:hypothetical protein [Lebetimonas natsushimae]GAX86765.1 conserved hypothetical protein [Lebetimonas natsushimae]
MKNVKLIIIFLISTVLFSFDVEFTKIEKKFIVPNIDAILIQTKENLTFPFQFYKIKNGYVLKDSREIENYLNNRFYAPKDAKFKNIKIAIIDYDKYQYEIIQKIKNKYNCPVKHLIFLNPDEEKIIFKPAEIELKYKIILDCN